MKTKSEERSDWRLTTTELSEIVLREANSALRDCTHDEAEDFVYELLREERCLSRCGHPEIDYTLERVAQEPAR